MSTISRTGKPRHPLGQIIYKLTDVLSIIPPIDRMAHLPQTPRLETLDTRPFLPFAPLSSAPLSQKSHSRTLRSRRSAMRTIASMATRTGSIRINSASSATDAILTSSATTSAVRAVLFDMDGVLCNSEVLSRKAGAEVMSALYGLDVSPDEFIPFTGTGEANFLGGVARKYGAPFEVESCKAKFFEIYMAKYAVPGAGIGYKGARALVEACRAAGLRTAVASSADLVKVHANLGAADIPLDLFDTVVSADAFERLKPFPDIFLAAASKLGVQPAECVVIEDAVAGVEAARAAGMRVIGVTTSLAEDAMRKAAPDAILPQISAIDVNTIQELKLREGGEEIIAAAKAKISQQA